MPFFNDIELAISAHSSWKQRLTTAIINGQCDEISPEDAGNDSHCAFGNWLYNGIGDEYRNGPLYDEICKLHKEFHQEASEILALAINGNQEAAKQRMISNGKYIRLSNQLITLLREWQIWLDEHHPE